jgi:hypothetical protein
MLTIFSVPKPFRGHIAVIQRNAITSWSRLHPRPEVVLFGDEEGTAEIAQELGLRHMPEVHRNEHGTPLLNDIFAKAQSVPSTDILCYVNADIVLLGDFTKAIQQMAALGRQFLMVGQRTNVDLQVPIDFGLSDWEIRMRALACKEGVVGERGAIDYLVFHRGLYSDVPPFALGRFWWDDWLLGRARELKVPVVDASSVVLAVHQNHDYGHYPKGKAAMFEGDEALANKKMANVGWWAYGLEDATHFLTAEGIRRNLGHYLVPLKRPFVRYFWAPLLDWTGPVRHPLGLRRRSIAAPMARIGLTKS